MTTDPQTDPLADAIEAAIWKAYADAEPSDVGLVLANPRTIAATAAAVARTQLPAAVPVSAAAPTVWIDGHPQLEAIAATVWERCGRSDSGSCVDDDPRNIAVAALAAVLAVLPPPADRAATRAEWDSLGREADRLRKDWFEMRARAERVEAEVKQLRADRAAVLREAADGFHRHAEEILHGVEGKAVFVAKALQDHAAVWREAAETLRRLADETAGPEAQAEALGFVTRVLEVFSLSHADAYGDLFWRVEDGEVHLSANVSDVFAWGGADSEPITPETLPALEQAYTDLKAVEAEEFTADLYAARQRGMRPQGAAYPSDTHESWRKVSALYDACGPVRGLGLGNPKPAPAHAAPAAVQTEEA